MENSQDRKEIIMKFVLDCHVHTIASGHAYSTFMDYVGEAKKKGLELIALTDHGPKMPGGPNEFHIINQIVIPEVIDGIRVLKGIEANIIGFDGSVDVPERAYPRLDLIIAGFHDVVFKPGTKEQNTEAFLKAMENEMIDIIAHPGNPKVPVDNEALVLGAKKYNKIIEINNASFLTTKSRAGSKENCYEIARLCNKHGVKMIAGTDSHVHFDLGVFNNSIKVFEEVGVDEELIMNTSAQKLVDYLNTKGRSIKVK